MASIEKRLQELETRVAALEAAMVPTNVMPTWFPADYVPGQAAVTITDRRGNVIPGSEGNGQGDR